MEKKRQIAKVGKKVSFAEEDDDDLVYWANLPLKERMAEATEWNKKVWKQILKDKYPEKIELIGGKRNKSTTDEDDF
jgi:hypothetical protein